MGRAGARNAWPVVLVAGAVATVAGAWWYGWGRLAAGPPEAGVDGFLRAAQSRDWAAAAGYLTQHTRVRIGLECMPDPADGKAATSSMPIGSCLPGNCAASGASARSRKWMIARRRARREGGA